MAGVWRVSQISDEAVLIEPGRIQSWSPASLSRVAVAAEAGEVGEEPFAVFGIAPQCSWALSGGSLERHGVKREEFLREYQGSELDPNWTRRVANLSGKGWLNFVQKDKGVKKKKKDKSAKKKETVLTTKQAKAIRVAIGIPKSKETTIGGLTFDNAFSLLQEVPVEVRCAGTEMRRFLK